MDEANGKQNLVRLISDGMGGLGVSLRHPLTEEEKKLYQTKRRDRKRRTTDRRACVFNLASLPVGTPTVTFNTSLPTSFTLSQTILLFPVHPNSHPPPQQKNQSASRSAVPHTSPPPSVLVSSPPLALPLPSELTPPFLFLHLASSSTVPTNLWSCYPLLRRLNFLRRRYKRLHDEDLVSFRQSSG